MSRDTPRQWQVDVSVGGALFAVGAGGVLTLLVSGGLASNPVWGEPWWWGTLIPFGLVAAAGGYMLAAVYFPWRLPETRAAREAQAQIEITEPRVIATFRDNAIVEVPVNVGRLDIDNATMNVRVPDRVTIYASNDQGAPAIVPTGGMAHSSESMEAGAGGLNYWRQSRVQLSAFTYQAYYFRVDFPIGSQPFPFEFRLTASALHGGVQIGTTVVPPS
jgi:hypothetical protein